MKFLDDIKCETLIICSNGDKERILKKNKLINVKIMNIHEFISKFCFDFDENAILYVMNKYNVKYEIAVMYIKNLYYVEDKVYNIKKLDFLVELKKELEENNLLIYNQLFKNYVKNVPLIIYGIRLSKYELNLLKGLDYQYIEREYLKYDHSVLSFETMEEEVEYVAFSICNLINDGVSISNIKITNVDSSYYNTLIRIFSLFGLKINVPYTSLLSSFDYVREFIKLYKENDLEYAVNKLDKSNKLYNSVIGVVNKYLKYNNKALIIYKLENELFVSDKYDNAINIVDYLDYSFGDLDYVFMLGFNDGIVPNSYKDINYITDNICSYVDLETTAFKNINLRDDILKSIYNIKNLIITYKLRDSKRTYYPSSLCVNFNVENGIIPRDISYSDVYNKIRLVRGIDDYIKYGYKTQEFNSLFKNFSVAYNSYDNRYKLINRVMDKLLLSYSKMQIYNKCAFRYYLSSVLKLDIYEENFSTVIGSMVHYVMEKCLSNNDMDYDKYVLEYLGDREFSNKEKFFLNKYRDSIKGLIEQVLLEREYSSFDSAMYEKKIDVDFGNNIIFTGIIDKVLYKEMGDNTYISLIDYKTGNDDISLKLLKYGINIQLPIYLYLSDYLNFRKILYSGFYLQKFNISDQDYRLIGYSNCDRNVLSVMDNNYENSKIIKGLKTLKDGSFSNYSKVLSNDDIEKIKNITKEQILSVINNIRNNNFDINPKVLGDRNIGCEYCKFRDICFVKSSDRVTIYEEEFGGDN